MEPEALGKACCATNPVVRVLLFIASGPPEAQQQQHRDDVESVCVVVDIIKGLGPAITRLPSRSPVAEAALPDKFIAADSEAQEEDGLQDHWRCLPMEVESGELFSIKDGTGGMDRLEEDADQLLGNGWLRN